MIDRIRDIDDESKNLYRQLQAYIDLKHMLGLLHPLPRLRGWAASPDFLIEIARHTINQKPQCILECSSGASTIVLARCLQLNNSGHVFSLEHDPVFAEITRKNLTECGLSDWATVLHAPLEPIDNALVTDWYSSISYKDINNIDLLVVDGPPVTRNALARYPAIPRLVERLTANAAIYLDDTIRPGEQEIVSRWMKEYPILLLRRIDLEKGCVELKLKNA